MKSRFAARPRSLALPPTPLAAAGLVALLAGGTACGGKTSHAGAGSSPPVTAPLGPACTNVPTTLVEPTWVGHAGQVSGIAANDTDVFYGLYEPSSVWRVPVRGGLAVELTSLTRDLDQLIATPSGVVFAQSNVDSSGKVTGQLVELPAAGGAPKTLGALNGKATALVSDGTSLFYCDGDGTKSLSLADASTRLLTPRTGTLGVAGDDVLLADMKGGDVLLVPKAGGATTTLATGQTSPLLPVQCGGDVCWLDQLACAGVPAGDVCVAGNGQGALVRMTPGSAPIIIAQTNSLFLASSMLFDGSSFFVTAWQDASPDGPLTVVPASGGAPIPMGGADAIAVSSGCVFVLDYIDGVSSFSSP